MTLKVVAVLDPAMMPVDFPEKIKNLGVEFSVHNARTVEERIAASRDADFIMTGLRVYPYSREIIEKLERCKFIETLGIGYEGADLEAATEYGIGIINARGLLSEELSDHAMSLILAHSRWILGLHNRVKMGKPVASAGIEATQRMARLKGKILGLIGFGNSGRVMVPKAKGFGMRILAYDPYVDRRVAEKLDVEMVSLDDLLEQADFVSIHANLTSENRHLIGLDQFKRMKRTAFIVNIARGPIIDEAALCVALSRGYIAGAGLDVTDPDPPPANSPLLQFDNVILTGHNAGASAEAHTGMWNYPIEQIARVLRREWPINLVNPVCKENYVAKWGPMRECADQ